MRILGVHGSATGAISSTRRSAADRREAEIPAAESRALIAVEPAAPSARQVPVSRYPAAPFLAHLIASRMQAPQTRALRRAAPEDAIAVYGLTHAPQTLGRLIRRQA